MVGICNFRAFPILVLFMGSACATIISDDKSTTYIETDPENARCELHGQDFKRVLNTPNSVSLPAEAAPITVACRAEGYKTTTQLLDTEIDGWIFGNILLGGIIGVIIDAATDSGEIYPAHITIILQPERFQSTTGRDSWFERRRTVLEQRWEKAISSIRDDCPGGDCEAEVSEAKEKRDKQLSRVEEERLRAGVAGVQDRLNIEPSAGGTTPTTEPPTEQRTPGTRLRRAEKLYRENAITKEEYESLRKKILNDI